MHSIPECFLFSHLVRNNSYTWWRLILKWGAQSTDTQYCKCGQNFSRVWNLWWFCRKKSLNINVEMLLMWFAFIYRSNVFPCKIFTLHRLDANQKDTAQVIQYLDYWILTHCLENLDNNLFVLLSCLSKFINNSIIAVHRGNSISGNPRQQFLYYTSITIKWNILYHRKINGKLFFDDSLIRD